MDSRYRDSGLVKEACVENDAGRENQHRAEREEEQVEERFDDGPLNGTLLTASWLKRYRLTENVNAATRALVASMVNSRTPVLEGSTQRVAEQPPSGVSRNSDP